MKKKTTKLNLNKSVVSRLNSITGGEMQAPTKNTFGCGTGTSCDCDDTHQFSCVTSNVHLCHTQSCIVPCLETVLQCCSLKWGVC